MRYRFALRLAIIITVAAVWLAACIPAQALSQSKLVSTVRKKIGPQGPTYIFKLYSVESLSNYHYQIEVCDEGGRIIFQSEVIRNGVRLEGQRGGFQVVDLNSDSYADVKVLGGYSEGRAWHKVWLYDPSTQKYVWDNRTSQSETAPPHNSFTRSANSTAFMRETHGL
jgi:hypothetical protein